MMTNDNNNMSEDNDYVNHNGNSGNINKIDNDEVDDKDIYNDKMNNDHDNLG